MKKKADGEETTVQIGESRASKALKLCEDKSEKVLGGAKTMGPDCPICKGKKLLDCPFCDKGACADGSTCTLCSKTGKIKCTMCHPDAGLPG